jgi:hypothetical protein
MYASIKWRKNTVPLQDIGKIKTPYLGVLIFAQRTGLEPATSRVTGGCSNQLSYLCNLLFCTNLAILRLQQADRNSVCRRKDLHLRPWVYESHALTT